MLTVRAKIRNGRLTVDEPTDLPDGEVELVAVMDHDHDQLDDESRAALHAALAQAKDDIDQGRLLDGDQVLERLRSRTG